MGAAQERGLHWAGGPGGLVVSTVCREWERCCLHSPEAGCQRGAPGRTWLLVGSSPGRQGPVFQD